MSDNGRISKILIVTPGLLPVPAVRGGAVEKLITDIIDENEISGYLDVTLITIDDENLHYAGYCYTRIVPVKEDYICKMLDRVIDKIQRMIHAKNSFRLFDRKLTAALKNVTDVSDFNVIIVENMVGVAETVAQEVKKKESRAQLFFHIHNNIDMYRSVGGIKKLSDMGFEFISVSTYLKGEILKAVPDANVEVLHNGLDTSLVSRKRAYNRKSVREKYGIPSDATVILYSGRIIAEKGVYELISSFVKYRVINQGSDLYMLLAGGTGKGGKSTDYEKRVRTEIKKCPNKIKYLGSVPYDDMAEIYSVADILAVPSLDKEPFGMVVLEGMAMGLPILTTANGGISEILEDEAGSIVVSEERLSDDLIEAFSRIDGEGFESTLKEMGAHNLELFLNKKDARKEDYYERFLSVIGINGEGKKRL